VLSQTTGKTRKRPRFAAILPGPAGLSPCLNFPRRKGCQDENCRFACPAVTDTVITTRRNQYWSQYFDSKPSCSNHLAELPNPCTLPLSASDILPLIYCFTRPGCGKAALNAREHSAEQTPKSAPQSATRSRNAKRHGKNGARFTRARCCEQWASRMASLRTSLGRWRNRIHPSGYQPVPGPELRKSSSRNPRAWCAPSTP